VKYGELRDDPIRIESITIDEPHLIVEQSGGKFNFQVLMDKQPQGPPPDSSNEPPMKLVIGTLGIKDAKVTIRPGNLPGGITVQGLKEEYVVALPTLMLQNIGSGEGAQNGAAMKEVVMTVITQMTDAAIKNGQLPQEVRLLLEGNLKGVANKMVEQGMARAADELQKKIGGEAGTLISGTIKDIGQPGADPGKVIEKGVGDLLKSTTRPSR
jgi:hypothetical protein